MRDQPATKDKLLDAACKVLAARGLLELTIGSVASEAGVSNALVHYHFDTKLRLSIAAAERVASERESRIASALGVSAGLATVDALWEALAVSAREGWERACQEFAGAGARQPEIAAITARHRGALGAAVSRRLPSLLRELGAVPATAEDDLATALQALIDGAGLALSSGADERAVRAGYDAFWLALVSARPRGGRR